MTGETESSERLGTPDHRFGIHSELPYRCQREVVHNSFFGGFTHERIACSALLERDQTKALQTRLDGSNGSLVSTGDIGNSAPIRKGFPEASFLFLGPWLTHAIRK